MNNKEPVITFTFDDFPRSAYTVGGSILNKYNYKATYYVSLGLLGKELPVGEGFILKDICNLLNDGHELACHTYDHHESWVTKKKIFENSIRKNSIELSKLIPDLFFNNFSFPKSNPSVQNKATAGKVFRSCRGGGQCFNHHKVDLNLLNSYFVDYKNNYSSDMLKVLVDKTIQVNGWLIISTHDISDKPSKFGCSTEFFNDIVDYIFYKEATVLNVNDVITQYFDYNDKL